MRGETEKLLAMYRKQAPQKIKDYTLQTLNGPKTLSSMFGEKKELILWHNMGTKCVYCTLWGDGFNGFTDHIQSRAAFVMVNGDDVATQNEFAKSRGWRFPMASSQGTTLGADLHFSKPGDSMHHPGLSILTKDASGQMYVNTAAPFGPGDIYCSIFNVIGMLPSDTDWEPKYKY